ncbi:MAG: hypothetical protein QM478_01930 [Flavobacteriaceae bacterium]
MIKNFKLYSNYIFKHNFLLQQKIREIEEYYENPKILDLKNERFKRLINRVFDNNKFYKKLYAEHGIEKSSIKTLDDIKKLPIINKQIVVKHSKLIKQGVPLLIGKGYTSGTTGTPLEVYRSYNSILTENAYVWWYRIKSGLNPKDRKISIRGDLDRNKLYFLDKYSNTLHISSFALNSTNIKEIVKLIKEFNPKAALGYPSSLFTISSWLLENNEELFIPLSFTSSESLLFFQEEKIKKAFNTNIFDWYGNSERTIALYRDENKYYEPVLYSINEYNVENVITTSLIGDYFPLIRYEVNDKIINLNDFNFKKKSTTISSIQGRIEEYIVLPDGSKVGSAALSLIFKDIDILNSQIIQNDKMSLVFNIVPGKHFSGKNKLLIKIQRKLGNSIQIYINLVEKSDILLTKSGKYKLVISKIKTINK